MAFVIVREDAAYQCAQCGHVLAMKRGQMLPPCPRCGGGMQKAEGAVEPPPPGCS